MIIKKTLNALGEVRTDSLSKRQSDEKPRHWGANKSWT